jgi:drug/metabolite transporter (DMT)-like permease
VATVTSRDRLLAVLATVLWGLNFLAVRIALNYFPPLFLAALRYLVLVVPVVLLVPRPDVPVRWLVGYGLGFGTAQFGLLFLAIEKGLPAGLSSVLVQAAAPFTVVLGVLLLGERPGRGQVGGMALAVAGTCVIAADRAQAAAVLPVVLTFLAALGWAVGNICSRLARPAQPLRFALWMSVIPPVPLLALSAAVEGPGADWAAVRHAAGPHGWHGLLALAYIAVIGTVLGAWIWTSLLARHAAGVVAPYSLLIPVVGIGGAFVALGERPSAVALAGAAAVVGGVLVGSRSPAATAATATAEQSRSPSGRADGTRLRS